MVDNKHVLSIENQEANYLAQIASGYQVSKDLFEINTC